MSVIPLLVPAFVLRRKAGDKAKGKAKAKTPVKTKAAKTKKLILLFGWLGLLFAGGYFYGRKASVVWNDDQIFLYMCRASHWIHTATGKGLTPKFAAARI
jgi:hypothetical protein